MRKKENNLKNDAYGTQTRTIRVQGTTLMKFTRDVKTSIDKTYIQEQLIRKSLKVNVTIMNFNKVY